MGSKISIDALPLWKVWYFMKKEKKEQYSLVQAPSYEDARNARIKSWPLNQRDSVIFYTESECTTKNRPTQ